MIEVIEQMFAALERFKDNVDNTRLSYTFLITGLEQTLTTLIKSQPAPLFDKLFMLMMSEAHRYINP